VRVTGGEARGRPLKRLRGLRIRPTSDRVREALFDILGQRVEGASFLDAFAGTGAVGIEALSRGARQAVFLERDKRAIRLIRENLNIADWARSSEVIEGEAETSLERLARGPARFSIIFLDPPYDGVAPGLLLEPAGRVLSPRGILVLEHRTSLLIEPPPQTILRRFRTYRHGDTSLTSFVPPAP